MYDYPEPLKNLIEAFRFLPGIGPKTAQRLAFFLLSRSNEEVEMMAKALLEAKNRIITCSQCGNLTDTDPCCICVDMRRDRTLICVVQESRDIITFERMGDYRGLYHVLHGALSPLDGIGPEELNVAGLLKRLQEGEVKELIIATNPNAEGDATALYLARLVKPLGIKVTRIGFGLPVGGDLEYADELTLSRALEGRREI
ncbi:MAG: recombination mediator RecR [Dethiobacteria bacterium]|jgi:recombination protein RecR|nr:recombination protein RecR [Bacillota bacterium]